jgi:hypothetical protein
LTSPAILPSFAFPTATNASLPSLNLTEDEQSLATWLATRLFDQRPYLEVRGLYYDGLQRMQDLGISIPPSLTGLRTVIGWPRIGVDAIVNRCRVEGFRYPGATDTDEDLWGIFKANRMVSESPLAFLDAMIYGRAYMVVGPGDDTTGGQPLITAESPMNMTAIWDARTRRCTASLQIYLDTDYTSDMYGQEVAALYLPDRTIFMARAASVSGQSAASMKWQITERDDHKIGQVPVVRLANRQRIGNREGLSEITPEWMNTTDSACRTLLGMEVGREFYSAPRRYILGASEDAFQKPDGSSVSAWEAYLNKVWAVERDEEGNVPTVGEFKAGDPSTHTKLIDTYAKIMSGNMGVPPHFLGVFSDGNPASADAIRSGYEELTIRSTNKHLHFGEGLEDVMRLALLIRDGSVPDKAHMIETDWTDPAPTTLAATSDAITKQVTVGSIPAHSDVTLKKLGYSAVERARLEADRLTDEGDQFLAQIAHSLVGKDARIDKGLAGDVTGSGPTIPSAAPPSPPANARP